MISVPPMMGDGASMGATILMCLMGLAVLVLGVLCLWSGIHDLRKKDKYDTFDAKMRVGAGALFTVFGVVIFSAGIDYNVSANNMHETMHEELKDQGYSEVKMQEEGFYAKKDGALVRCYFAEMEDTWKITC